MLQIPSNVLLAPAGSDRISWITELDQGIWTAPHAGTIVSGLRNPSKTGSLLDSFGPGEPRERAADTLDAMVSRGLLVSSSCAPHLAELCREFRIDPQYAERKRWLEGATIIATDAEMGAALGSALTDAGVILRPNSGFQIVATADYLDSRIESIHRAHIESGQPWMLAKPVGTETWIGPVIIPTQTPCWRCLEFRLREHRWLESQVSLPTAGALLTPYSTPGRLRSAVEFIAHEAARWMLEAADSLEGTLWSFSWETLQARRHAVMRRPNCADCGSAPHAPSIRVELAPTPARDDFRTRTASELLRVLDPLASPITGILRRFEETSLPLPRGMHAYAAIYCPGVPPAGRRIENAIVQPAVCAGTGQSRDEAMAACLAEAVERYSIQFRGDEPCLNDSFTRLGTSAIHPSDVLLVSEAQFSVRQPGDDIPEPFDEDEEVDWLEGWSLTDRRPRFLPLALSVMDYRAPGKRRIGDADSSGCAAGSCLEEAILHGLLELIERDAVGIWWYNRIALPVLDREFLEGRPEADLVEQLASQGWSVRVHDITTDLAIPTAVAIAENAAGQWILGSAAHLHGPTALRNALRELTLLSRSRVSSALLPPPAQSSATGMAQGLVLPRPLDLKDTVEHVCRLITGAGHEIVAFNLTRPDIAFPVVRVVVPGLRHKAPRFAPGRLYDVPVRMGWSVAPNKETDLSAIRF